MSSSIEKDLQDKLDRLAIKRCENECANIKTEHSREIDKAAFLTEDAVQRAIEEDRNVKAGPSRKIDPEIAWDSQGYAEPQAENQSTKEAVHADSNRVVVVGIDIPFDVLLRLVVKLAGCLVLLGVAASGVYWIIAALIMMSRAIAGGQM